MIEVFFSFEKPLLKYPVQVTKLAVMDGRTDIEIKWIIKEASLLKIFFLKAYLVNHTKS